MLDLKQYASLGDALRAAIETWPDELCLIEADRDRENCRLTYRQFSEKALPLAAALQQHGFGPGSRAAIIMTNQSKWLLSAYAVFYCGGVLVPLDYKLTPAEQLQLLAHSGAQLLFTENHIWRALPAAGLENTKVSCVVVSEAPAAASLAPAQRWETFQSALPPRFIPRRPGDWACIVYSSGTAGRPKGCVLTHDNYLRQCMALSALYPFWPGVRYLSILPTNHAIDFMVGFIGPFTCGATVVHLRTLRPDYIRQAFKKYRISYMSLVPAILKNLEQGLQDRFAQLPPYRRFLLHRMTALNRLLTRRRPRLALSRLLLPGIHQAFGGQLRALFVGGAFSHPATLRFFYNLGIPVSNGYGCTEAGTAITLNDLRPFRAGTVGKPLPGMQVRILDADSQGIGEIAVCSKTVMSHYLDDPELTAETIVDGWLHTGDLGRIESHGHLQLLGRKKNMIVTEEGKNIYPEDIEAVFTGLAVKEFCIFAANYLWPQRAMSALGGEQLLIVLRTEADGPIGEELLADLARRNHRLLNYKRISGYLHWPRDFPRTASLKIKRDALAQEIRARLDRSAVVPL